MLTDVSGHITADDTWTLADSPFVLVGNVYIDAGVTLTIESGVEVNTPNTSRDVIVAGLLAATGTQFTGSTDIDLKSGGRLNLSTSSVAGEEVLFNAGSMGTVSESQFSSAQLGLFSENVSVDDNTFSLTEPVETNPSLVPELYNNHFSVDATVLVVGTATTDAVWHTIPGLSKYKLTRRGE